jgi:hypothetical protein
MATFKTSAPTIIPTGSVAALLRASALHCSLAVTPGAPVEYRLRHLERAQRATLQALACINGACGVAPPKAPRADRHDRPATIPGARV